MNVKGTELDEFTVGYLEAAIWADSAEPGESADDGRVPSGADLFDFAPEALKQAADECATFQARHANDLIEASEKYSRPLEHSGHDFWLTRQGHGTGFWDRGMGDVGQRLTEGAKDFGYSGFYLGDDGLTYF
jgi:hypothetical protein